MPLRSALTPAVVAGPWPARALTLLALAAVAAALLTSRRRPDAVGHNGPRPEVAAPRLSEPSTTKEPIR